MFELPPYDELRSTARSDFKDSKSVYYRGLYAELQKPHKRKDTIVNHPINDGKPEYLPAVITNSDIPTIDKGCSSRITCDVHYEQDWSYRLQKEMTCDEAVKTDVCFVSYACVCSNGYYRITADMPAVPIDYVGSANSSVLNRFRKKISDGDNQSITDVS